MLDKKKRKKRKEKWRNEGMDGVKGGYDIRVRTERVGKVQQQNVQKDMGERRKMESEKI